MTPALRANELWETAATPRRNGSARGGVITAGSGLQPVINADDAAGRDVEMSLGRWLGPREMVDGRS